MGAEGTCLAVQRVLAPAPPTAHAAAGALGRQQEGQGVGLGQQGGNVAREVGGSCAAGHPRRHEVCFLLDAMLGRLCRWLRCLGVDADMVPQNLTRQQLTDMAVQASAQGRIFLTRDSSLVVRRDFAAAATFLLTSSQTSLQLQDVAARWGLTFDATKAMTRCSICNGAEYETLSRMQAAELQVPAKVLNSVDEFYRCRTCHKVVWMGPKSLSAANYMQGMLARPPVAQ
ncbi:Mut7-C RNAse domain-containing protein [Haematococcus lacustris]